MSLTKLSLSVLVEMRVVLLHQLQPLAGTAALAREELEKGSSLQLFPQLLPPRLLGLHWQVTLRCGLLTSLRSLISDHMTSTCISRQQRSRQCSRSSGLVPPAI
jgi:hypothetical protein